MHPHPRRAFAELRIATGTGFLPGAASGPVIRARSGTESPGCPRIRDDAVSRFPDVRRMWSLGLLEQMRESRSLQQVSRPFAKPAQIESLPPVSRGLKNFNQHRETRLVDIRDFVKIHGKALAGRRFEMLQ